MIKIDELIKESMKAKTRTRTEVLRAIKTAFLVYETQKNAKPLDEAAETAIIKKLRNQRLDNAEQYKAAGRMDLYTIETEEAAILSEFLPVEPDEQMLALALACLCAEHGWKDSDDVISIPKKEMSIAIKELKQMYPGADGKTISELVKHYIV